MHSFKISRFFLAGIVILLGMAVALSLALPNHGPARAQDGALETPAAQASPASESGDGLGEVFISSAALGGDGNPEDAAPDIQAADDFGPDALLSPQVAFSYFRLVGTAFNPRTSTTTFAYNFDGCVYETAGSDNRFMAPLLLPDGAVIKYLRLYFKDTSAGTDLTAWITRYQPGVTSNDLVSVDSSGSSGYGTTLSQEITHTVDLNSWAYTIIIAPNGNNVSNSFCGVRVAYYAPYFGSVALPVILKSTP